MAQTISREVHTIDASGQTPGRLATTIAMWLMGKNKPTFTPHIDAGDFVSVVHTDQLRFTGKKFEQSTYKSHSGYQGGLKVKTLKAVHRENPNQIIRRAVSRMLPKNKHRTARLKRLRFLAS